MCVMYTLLAEITKCLSQDSLALRHGYFIIKKLNETRKLNFY